MMRYGQTQATFLDNMDSTHLGCTEMKTKPACTRVSGSPDRLLCSPNRVIHRSKNRDS
jgi:hypothetical protein